MLTVQELSKRLDTPERTIRRWIDVHGPFLGARKDGRRLLVPADRLQVAETIKALYASGATSDQVNDTLAGRAVPQVFEVDAVTPMQAESLVKELVGLMQKQSAEMAELRHEMREIREFLLTQSATAAATTATATTATPATDEQPKQEREPGFWARLWHDFWSD